MYVCVSGPTMYAQHVSCSHPTHILPSSPFSFVRLLTLKACSSSKSVRFHRVFDLYVSGTSRSSSVSKSFHPPFFVFPHEHYYYNRLRTNIVCLKNISIRGKQKNIISFILRNTNIFISNKTLRLIYTSI